MALSPLQQGLFSLAGLTDSETTVRDPYVIAMAADIDGALDAGAAARLRRGDAGAPSQPAGQLLPAAT